MSGEAAAAAKEDDSRNTSKDNYLITHLFAFVYATNSAYCYWFFVVAVIVVASTTIYTACLLSKRQRECRAMIIHV